MDKLRMHSPNLTQENIARVRELFPDCVMEAQDKDSNMKLSVDFDLLRQELSESIVEGPQERYQLDWPGKREALLIANAPIAKALRPCRKESVDFDSTNNIFIEGDNLEALKLLQETYLGKVKMIYIDPPYNTGNDYIFEDNFAEDADEFLRRSNQKDEDGNRLVANTEGNGRFHSDWLNMMYPRLKLARNLLTDDGIVMISIDENEHSNLIKLCELIFGSDNFCGDIVWKNGSRNDQDYISIQHEYFVVFVKSKQFNKGEWTEKKSGLDNIYEAFAGFRKKYGNDWKAIHKAAVEWYKQFPESNPITDSKHYSWMDERGVYFPDNISGPNVGQYVYDVEHPITGKIVKAPSRGWSCPPEKLKELIDSDLVHFGPDENTVPCLKTYLKNTEYKSLSSILFKDGRAASKRLRSLFGEAVFTNPKDEEVLQGLFKAMGVKGNDIVLDFFAGSASTIHAVFGLNKEQGSQCRAILVQWPEDLHTMYKTAKGTAKTVVENAINYLKKRGLPQNICEIAKERIRLVGTKLYGSQLPELGLNDIGFRVFKIDSSNMSEVYYTPDTIQQSNLGLFADNIKSDRSPEDLLFQVLLDWGVDLALPIRQEAIEDKVIFFVDENSLIACFDSGVNEDLVMRLAEYEPLRVVFRDNGFESDAVKINVEQIFKQLSPVTEVKSI